MKRFLGQLLRYRLVSLPGLLGLIFVLAGWIWTSLELRGAEAPLIIHFNNYVGINRTGGLLDLALIGVLGVIMTTANLIIGLELEERDWFFGKLSAAIGLLVGVLIFIGFMVIMKVN